MSLATGSTRTNFIAAIKREARIVNDSQLDTLLDDLVDEVCTSILTAAKPYELLIRNTLLAATTNVSLCALPSDFWMVHSLRLKPNTGVIRELYPRNDNTLIKEIGIPEFYYLVGTQIAFYPFSLLNTATMEIFIDYYKKPVFNSGSDVFPVPRLQTACKLEILARLAKYENKLQLGDAHMKASAFDTQRGEAADPDQLALFPVDTRKASEAVQ